MGRDSKTPLRPIIHNIDPECIKHSKMGRDSLAPLRPIVHNVDPECASISDAKSNSPDAVTSRPCTINNEEANRILASDLWLSDSETDSRDVVNSLPCIVNNVDANCLLASDLWLSDSETDSPHAANSLPCIVGNEHANSILASDLLLSDSESDSGSSGSSSSGSGIEIICNNGLIYDGSDRKEPTVPDSVKPSIITSRRDEEEDDIFNLKLNDVLRSPLNNFIVLEFLGSGTFGKVIKCRTESTGEFVAIKLLRINSCFTEEGEGEMKRLRLLNESNAHEQNIVRFYENFEYHTHKCLVFEALEQSLYDHLRGTHHQPMALPFIRTITSQVLVALVHLMHLGILHTDIKPENIMLVDSLEFPYRVKLIDFGSSCHASDISHCKPYIQTRWYRAPEIILGLPFSAAIDVWSLGCVLAEMCAGPVLYRGQSEYDMMRLITQSHGFLPGPVLRQALKVNKFFVCDNVAGTGCPVWRLKTREEVEPEARSNESKTYTRDLLHSLVTDTIPKDLSPDDVEGEMKDREAFLDILGSLLMLEQRSRITAQAALDHPFLTLAHLPESTYANRYQQSQLALINAQPPRCAKAQMGIDPSEVRTLKTNSSPSNTYAPGDTKRRNKRQYETELDISSLDSRPTKRQNIAESPAE